MQKNHRSSILRALGYLSLYCVAPIAMSGGLDFGGLETDIEETIVNGKKIVVMIGFALSVLTYLFTRNIKAVAGLVGLIFLSAQGLEIALEYMGL